MKALILVSLASLALCVGCTNSALERQVSAAEQKNKDLQAQVDHLKDRQATIMADQSMCVRVAQTARDLADGASRVYHEDIAPAAEEAYDAASKWAKEKLDEQKKNDKK